jgi:hypothetical protein
MSPIFRQKTFVTQLCPQELAERRSRPPYADRQSIADRTAKVLRQLATPSLVYRERPFVRNTLSSRRVVNLSELPNMSQEEMDVEEEDDDFEALMDNSSTVEGVRLNPDLYEAYTPAWTPTMGSAIPRRPPSSNATSLASTAAPESSTDTASLSAPIANRTPPWTFTSGTIPPSLQRQPSIRRPTRGSRTMDFSDFTSRRRSTIRQNAAQEGGSSRSEEISDDSGVTLLLPGDEEVPVVQLPNESASTSRGLSTRRLFPMNRARPRREGNEPALSPLPEPSWLEEASDSWFALPTPISSSPSQDADSGEERSLVPPSAPRLRRGGLRAPESMVLHAPALVEFPSTSRVENDPVSRPPSSPRLPLRFETTASQSRESAAGDQGSSTHDRHTEVINGVILTESTPL